MKFSPTQLDGVVLIEAIPVGDDRGWFSRHYCPVEFETAGIDFTPCQISQSFNAAAATLRGLHYQDPPHSEAKLVRCLRGAVWDVGVDIRPDSPTRHQWLGVELRPEFRLAVLWPKGFAHGFITLEPNSELLYITDYSWTHEAEGGLRWNDPALGISWPLEPDVLSDRDSAHPLLGRHEE
ncbi:MAG: dTDP-4-dehydrorhamnose 3,5-epimerase family protein [Pseudomonadota bacterium]